MDVTMPDGTVIRGVPDGVSKEEILRKYKRKEKFLKTPQFEKDALAIKNTDPVDLIMGSAPGRFVTGVSDMGVGALQLGAHATGVGEEYMDRVVKEREEATRRGDLAYGREGFDWMRLGGNTMNPVALKAGVASPASMSGKVTTGGILGAGFGASAPVENTENYAGTKMLQTGLGGILGAGIPLLGEAVKKAGGWAYHIAEPVLPWGKKAIKGREYVRAAGEKADDVAALLRKNEQLVPGSRPTAGEAAAPAGSTGFSSLQAKVSKADDVIADDYLARAREQDAARRVSIGKIARTDAAIKSAEGKRAGNALIGYGKAWAKQIDGDGELVDIASSKYFDDAFNEAINIAETEKISTNSAHFLHLVKRQLDKHLARVGDKAFGGEEKRAVTRLRGRLLDWIEDKIPDYKSARLQFQQDSGPINRMRAGQELEKTLNQPISDFGDVGAQRISPWMAAMRDATRVLKKTSGEVRFKKLEDFMEPPEMARIDGVTKDLVRMAQHQQNIKGSARGTGNIVSGQMEREYGAKGGFPLLNRVAMIFNNVVKRTQGKADADIEMEMAKEMLNDPPLVAEIMRKAMVPKKKIGAFVEQLERLTGMEAGKSPLGYPSLVSGGTSEASRDADAAITEIRTLLTP